MKQEVLEQNHFYHIYNRGINGCSIFNSNENKRYFLELLKKHLGNFIDLYAFCLMDNHFHLLVKLKRLPDIVTQKFSNFFNAYAKAFNKQEGRTGSLFEKNFKRIKITDESYLRRVIVYINLNPTHHLGVDSLNYSFSSLNICLSKKDTSLRREEVLALFEGKQNFEFHYKSISEILEEKYKLE